MNRFTCAFVALSMMTSCVLHAQNSTTSKEIQSDLSPLTRQLWEGKIPDTAETERLKDQFFYQRAIEAYMFTLPALSVIGMRDGSEEQFGKGYNVLPIWKDRMNAKTWVPTPNCDVIYSMSYLDLKETGPLVVYAPPNVIGMFTDFFQRTITDVGAIGPDRSRGGLYLLLPPDHEGHIPSGYFSFKSPTYNVFLFFRTVLEQGEDGPDTTKAVATAMKTRVYPLALTEQERKEMIFPNASNIRVNMMYPTDYTYWEKLKKFIDYEAEESISPEVRGILASIGIVKNKPFEPNEQQKSALKKAVEVAPKMIYAWRNTRRADGKDLYYPDRQYLSAWAGADADWFRSGYLDVDQRSAYFQYAYSSAPAMAMGTINQGSKYPFTAKDKEGNWLDGSHSYKLHLPPGIPAKLYWAVTIYNPADGTMPETSQPFPSRNQFDQVSTNKDGSIDLYFGPKKPNGVSEKNWIETLPNRFFLVALRLYGSSTEFYDQTWKPDDLDKLD